MRKGSLEFGNNTPLGFAREKLRDAEGNLAMTWFQSLPSESRMAIMDLVRAGNNQAVQAMYERRDQVSM
jgi:hypothetical protein